MSPTGRRLPWGYLAVCVGALACGDGVEDDRPASDGGVIDTAAAGAGGGSPRAGAPGDSGATTGGAGQGGVPGTTTTACLGPPPALQLVRVAGGLVGPVALAVPAGDDSRIFVAEHAGRIRLVRNGTLLDEPFLDLRGSVTGAAASNDERGLLGLAFHPSYATNGRFFVFYTRRSDDPFSAGGTGDIVVAEGARSPTDADRAAPNVTPLFVVPHRYETHNGGQLAFGPDGKLWVGIGEGQRGDDAQATDSLLGKVLRVDVGAGPPAQPTLAPEIVALGLRNPWRFSFDRANGDVYIGDVGSTIADEIDRIPAATTTTTTAPLNFGWPHLEGETCRQPSCTTGALVAPIWTYRTERDRCVIGGFVYRGTQLPCLAGRYVFGDYASNAIWSATAGGPFVDRVDHSADLGSQQSIAGLTSFAEDARGELLVASYSNGTIYRIAAE